jgi:hypothetical protein
MSSVLSRSDSELKIWVSSNAQRWRDRAAEMCLLALRMKDAQAKAALLSLSVWLRRARTDMSRRAFGIMA